MKDICICVCIVQALRVALLRAPPNTFFEDTFMWSGEDAFPAAEFPPATELLSEGAFGRRFSRSRISPRHRITQRRRFSKTLFPQPNFHPPPNYPTKTLSKTLLLQPNFHPPPNYPTKTLSKTLLLQPNFSPPPNCLAKTLFGDSLSYYWRWISAPPAPWRQGLELAPLVPSYPATSAFKKLSTSNRALAVVGP